ncbi:endoplasmic reticulum resident protein 27 [Scyliorhinus canicula]|uniref:endoplasmic reticulum resident protein 27 n=1 Tax=Scyliorhinus canicula TaxID=7830 RepID=UPI0018F45667|nr:endoplasmic reticulum resident protein 27 [Scyliorhinus canicula]
MIARSLLLLILLPLCCHPAENESLTEDEEREKYPEKKEEQIQTPIPPKDKYRRVWMLSNVVNAEDFINDSWIAVVAFLKELNSTEADVLNEVIHAVKNLPFGICANITVWKKYNITNNTISLFKKFDEGRIDYEFKDMEVEPSQVIQFLRLHAMRLVIEYNHMDASQIFGSGIPIHLLLLVSKKSSGYETHRKLLQTIAADYRGKVVFILVNADVKENSRVSSYFNVKKADLPAACIFHVVTETMDVLKATDISTESLRQFCDNFIEGKDMKLVRPPRPPSEEL